MLTPMLGDCTGALVAGGLATRLGGVPKGLLRAGGETIAARSLRLFGELFAASMVVANDPAPYAALGVQVVQDLVSGKGAPAGLHAALSAARTEWVFAAACDMPFLSREAILFLAARRAGADAVAVRTSRGLEPLHAFWSVRCFPALDRLLREGDPSFRDLAERVNARIVGEDEWREVDPEGLALANANTLDDVARLGLAGP